MPSVVGLPNYRSLKSRHIVDRSSRRGSVAMVTAAAAAEEEEEGVLVIWTTTVNWSTERNAPLRQ